MQFQSSVPLSKAALVPLKRIIVSWVFLVVDPLKSLVRHPCNTQQAMLSVCAYQIFVSWLLLHISLGGVTYVLLFQRRQVGQERLPLYQSELHVFAHNAQRAIVLGELTFLQGGTQGLRLNNDTYLNSWLLRGGIDQMPQRRYKGASAASNDVRLKSTAHSLLVRRASQL